MVATNYKGDTSELVPHQQKLLKLRDILIELGGEECRLPFKDEDIDKILSRGFLSISLYNEVEDEHDAFVMSIEGEPIQCDKNSVRIWTSARTSPEYKDKLKIMTGYALSDDGMWYQHTWCVLEDCDNIDGYNTLIETTVERLAYFGLIMTEEEIIEFASWY